jgi:GTPase SAR1 family protein
MGFGQLVIGAPGSGKTTYCHGIAQYLNSIGRETAIVNLDPGNDLLPYDCAVDVMDLVKLEEVMDEMDLGPNGGLVYCMEYIEKNLDWLQEQLTSKCKNKYILFDLPGQVELFTHHHSVRVIAEAIVEWGWQLCVVHLVDAHHCSDSSKFLSTALVALSAMTMLELPHVNILSKIDLIRALGRLDFNLDYYLRSSELERLPQLMRVKEGLDSASEGGQDEEEDEQDEEEESEAPSCNTRHGKVGEDGNEGGRSVSGSHEGLEGRRQVKGHGGAGKARIDNAQRKWRKLEEVKSVLKGSSPALRQHALEA